MSRNQKAAKNKKKRMEQKGIIRGEDPLSLSCVVKISLYCIPFQVI